MSSVCNESNDVILCIMTSLYDVVSRARGVTAFEHSRVGRSMKFVNLFNILTNLIFLQLKKIEYFGKNDKFACRHLGKCYIFC